MTLARASSLLSLLLVLVFCAGDSFAQTKYALGGNARFQIGGGLPLPITTGAPPTGRILPIPEAKVTQTAGGKMTIKPGQLTNPAAPQYVKGQFPNNAALFEVQSNLGFSWPAPAWGAAVFSAGGRTGSSVTTKSPGGSISGFMRYTATGAQFGGPGRGAISGTAKVWAVAVSPPPCAPGPTCIAAKMIANPAPTAVIGGTFGVTNYTSPVNQVPGVYVVGANSNGTIFFRTPTPNGNPGPTNAAQSYGGPWTTGKITVSQPGATGPIELFVLSGSDARVSGVGNISLVAAALSTRNLSGPNANRGWLNLTISPLGPTQMPSLSSGGIASLALLLAFGGTALLWRARR